MPVMIIQVANLEEQLIDMKVTLDRLSNESAEKDAQIKRQNKQITDLTKKLRKRSSKASNKGSGGKILTKEYNHSKESNNENKPMNDSALSSMSVEQI